MKNEFWHNAWEERKTGWRQQRVNARLVTHWPQVRHDQPAGLSQSPVFVPLCGDSPDLTWLREQGHQVIGCELSEIAVRRYFEESGLSFDATSSGQHLIFESENITIYCGDYFSLAPDQLCEVRYCYDRAAAVALPAELRPKYAAQMSALLPIDASMLLISFEYDQTKMNGPPFSVDDAEVRRNYGKTFGIVEWDSESGPDTLGNLKERGLDSLTQRVYLLKKLPD